VLKHREIKESRQNTISENSSMVLKVKMDVIGIPRGDIAVSGAGKVHGIILMRYSTTNLKPDSGSWEHTKQEKIRNLPRAYHIQFA
jgi:hypothetical protein